MGANNQSALWKTWKETAPAEMRPAALHRRTLPAIGGIQQGVSATFHPPGLNTINAGQDLSLGFSPKRILHSPTCPARRETLDRSRKINEREGKSRDRSNQPSVAGIYG